MRVWLIGKASDVFREFQMIALLERKLGHRLVKITKFEFKTYRLEYRVYETQPDAVKEAKRFIRGVVSEHGYT